MDILSLTKSKTRRAILNLFYADPEKHFYLHQIRKILGAISVGNIRRELLTLVALDILKVLKKGRIVYYHLDSNSPLFPLVGALLDQNKITTNVDIVADGRLWITSPSPVMPDIKTRYCQTRDIFQARLETFTVHLEENIGQEKAWLITAVAGEIGNNSFDHNLGNWPSLPGVYFASDNKIKTIVLADRGQGIMKTISRVRPLVENDREALKIAFTQYVSGRAPEKRGNGLKFVSGIIKENDWDLRFYSGRALLQIKGRKIKITGKKRIIHGCLAVLRYH